MKPIKTLLAFTPAAALTFAMASFGSAGMAHADSHGAMSHHGTMHVTKSPTCGCCGAWVALARAEGYDIEVTDTADVTTVKLDADIPGVSLFPVCPAVRPAWGMIQPHAMT